MSGKEGITRDSSSLRIEILGSSMDREERIGHSSKLVWTSWCFSPILYDECKYLQFTNY